MNRSSGAGEDMVHPALALFYFLLHLSIQMRLDKLDGVGDTAWADDGCVDATLTGFFHGLESRKDFLECCGSAAEFLKLLKSFGRDDLKTTFRAVAAQFEQTKDFPVIEKYLEDHIGRFYSYASKFPLMISSKDIRNIRESGSMRFAFLSGWSVFPSVKSFSDSLQSSL